MRKFPFVSVLLAAACGSQEPVTPAPKPDTGVEVFVALDVPMDVFASEDRTASEVGTRVDGPEDAVQDRPDDRPEDRTDVGPTDAGPRCPPGESLCVDQCVNTATDRNHCGVCGNVCRAGRTCVKGECGIVCATGETLCAGGCSTLQDDVMNCGRCANECRSVPGATVACTAGNCTSTCLPGRADCGNPLDGCETDLNTSLTHCGTCGAACRAIGPNRGPPSCVDGRCVQGACSTGYGDCDGNAANGCETNLASNSLHCGRCGNACPSPLLCISPPGECACQGGRTACDGACIEPTTNRDHCGRCGNRCAPNEACTAGVCGARCRAEETLCGEVLCANLTNDSSHCGRCYNACPFGRVCRDGMCAP